MNQFISFICTEAQLLSEFRSYLSMVVNYLKTAKTHQAIPIENLCTAKTNRSNKFNKRYHRKQNDLKEKVDLSATRLTKTETRGHINQYFQNAERGAISEIKGLIIPRLFEGNWENKTKGTKATNQENHFRSSNNNTSNIKLPKPGKAIRSFLHQVKNTGNNSEDVHFRV